MGQQQSEQQREQERLELAKPFGPCVYYTKRDDVTHVIPWKDVEDVRFSFEPGGWGFTEVFYRINGNTKYLSNDMFLSSILTKESVDQISWNNCNCERFQYSTKT